MTAYINRFGSTYAGATVLPLCAADQDIGTDEHVGGAVELPGGLWYNAGGTAATQPIARIIQFTGSYKAATAAALQTLEDGLRAPVGTYNKLWMLMGDATQRWRYARLLAARATVRPDGVLSQAYELSFALFSSYWHGADRSSSGVKAGSPFTLDNDGNRAVTDPVLTWTPAGTDSTTFSLTVTGITQISYTGTVAAGSALVIDCGQRSVLNNGANAYTAAFTLTASHTIDNWLSISPSGGVSVILATDAAGGTLAWAYDDGWA
jgi:hypothetical protein